MEVRIPFALSNTTRPEYERALQDVKQSEQQHNGKVVRVEIQEVGPGQYAGVIVMEEPVGGGATSASDRSDGT